MNISIHRKLQRQYMPLFFSFILVMLVSRLATRRLRGIAARRNASSVSAALFQREPPAPRMRTALPGPEAQAAVTQLDRVFDTRSLNMLVDYDQCRGN